MGILLALSLNTYAGDFTDLKFGQAQIADSQWNVSSCMYTTTCQIYSKNPGTVYKIPWTSGQLSWSSGDYVAFVATGNATNPYNAIQYNSSGVQKAVMGTGHIINMGSDYFFFVGNDNNTGQLFSMTTGFSNTSGVSWTGTLNPTITQVNTYAAGGSTTPLAAGQTVAPAGPNYTAVTNSIISAVTPTSSNSPANETASKALDSSSTSKYLNFDRANAGFTITLNAGKVISGIKFTTANDYEPRDPTKFTLYGSNDGKTWTEITANQSTTLSSVSARYTQTSMITINNSNPYVYYFITFPSIKAIDTYGSVSGCQAALGTLACDSVQIAEVTYYYDSNNTATSTSTLVGSIANPGTAGATSSMNTTPTVVSTAPGTSSVVVTETPGTTVTTTNVTRGSTVDVTTYNNTRGDRGVKELTIIRTTTVTSTTPVTTVVTQTTPVTITTVTTPTTITTYSDGSTTTTNDTPVTVVTTRNDVTTTTTIVDDVQVVSSDQNYTTRIDQMDKLTEVNTRINYSLLSDPLSRNSVNDNRISNRSWDDRDINAYIHGSMIKSNTADGYKYNVTNDTFGAEHRINRSSLLGIQYNRINTTLEGTNGGGSLFKEAVTLYGLYVNNDWIYKFDLGQSNNSYYTHHSLPELSMSNNAKTNGTDTWKHIRVYTPSKYGFRPFIGARQEHNNRDYVMENGSTLTAVDYTKLDRTNDITEYGVRYEHQFNKHWTVSGEFTENNNNLSSVYGTVMYNAENNSSMILKIGQQKQNDVTADIAQIQLRISF